MDEQELGFNAWILVGNGLNAALNAWARPLFPDDQCEQLLLIRRLLDPVPPDNMLNALRRLPAEDRALLLQVAVSCLTHAGEASPSLLGMDADTAAPVLAFLAKP